MALLREVCPVSFAMLFKFTRFLARTGAVGHRPGGA
jgi:hypothetical protein